MTERLPYAILRIGKIHTRSILDAVEWHNTRQIPAGTVEGLPPPEEWLDMEGRYRDRADKILAETGATHDKGKILAVEVLVTASPEWWMEATEEAKAEWWRAQIRFAKELFGPGLLAFTPHVDESTPHAQFVGLPLYHAIEKKPGRKPQKPEEIRRRADEEAKAPKIWRLSHDKVFGGSPEKLADLQTRYHGYVKHLGLARGRDTVGLGIRHQTLKHYKQLLTKMDKDLSRIAEEQAEERQVLEHYENRLKEDYSRQKEQLAEIEKDKLDIFRQQEEARIRDERLSLREMLIRSSKQSLTLREAEAAAKEAELERREQEVEERENLVAKRETEVASREQEAGTREYRLVRREGEADRRLAQIAIVVGVLTGKIATKWNASKARPEITSGQLTESEQQAAENPWPVVLAAALRHAARMADARRDLAAKMRGLLARVRSKLRNAARLEEQATKSADQAKMADSEAQARLSSAARKEADADRILREAEERQRVSAASVKVADQQREDAKLDANRAREALSDLHSQIDDARSETSQVKSVLAEEEKSLAATLAKTEAQRAELASLQAARENLEVETESLASEKAKLEKVVASLGNERAALEKEQRKVAEERAEVSANKARLDRSAEVWELAVQSEVAIVSEGSRIVLEGHDEEMGKTRQSIEVDKLLPSIPPLLSRVQALKNAEAGIDRMLGQLNARRKALAERYSDQKDQLLEEQADDKKAVERMWSGFASEGQQR